MSETFTPEYSPFDQRPRFAAFAEHEAEISTIIADLLGSSRPETVEVDITESQVLLSPEEIRRLWGIFPTNARARALPNPPIIKSGAPRWFTHFSSPTGVVATQKVEEAIAPTAHGLARRDVVTGIITVLRIPENDFSDEVNRLVQAVAVVHDLAHDIDGRFWNTGSDYKLSLPIGTQMPIIEWLARFALTAEQYPPISRYSSAYRDANNMFPREGGALVIGVAVAEELAEAITAELLGFIVTPNGLSFEPFKDRADLHKLVQNYLSAKLASR